MTVAGVNEVSVGQYGQSNDSHFRGFERYLVISIVTYIAKAVLMTWRCSSRNGTPSEWPTVKILISLMMDIFYQIKSTLLRDH